MKLLIMSGAHQIIWWAPDYVYNSPSYGSRIGQSTCVSSKILHVSRDVTLLALDLANDRPRVAKNLLTPLPWYWKGAQGNGRRHVAFRGHCKELYMKHEHNSSVENRITGKERTDEQRIICFFGEKQKMGKNRKKGNEDCFILWTQWSPIYELPWVMICSKLEWNFWKMFVHQACMKLLMLFFFNHGF